MTFWTFGHRNLQVFIAVSIRLTCAGDHALHCQLYVCQLYVTAERRRDAEEQFRSTQTGEVTCFSESAADQSVVPLLHFCQVFT